MKKACIIFAACFLLTAATASCAAATGTGTGDRIRLSFSCGEILVRMEDNPAARDLLSMLPLTLAFEDYNSTEKVAYPPRKLKTDGAPGACDPNVGSLTCYAPWGNLALFYKDYGHSRGLVPLGTVESGLDKLPLLDKAGKVTISKL